MQGWGEGSSGQQQASLPTSSAPVVINLLDKPRPDSKNDESSLAMFGLNSWQTVLVLVAITVCLLMLLYYWYKKGTPDSTGFVDPLTQPGASLGGYGGTGF
jgi:hypothetical protein